MVEDVRRMTLDHRDRDDAGQRWKKTSFCLPKCKVCGVPIEEADVVYTRGELFVHPTCIKKRRFKMRKRVILVSDFGTNYSLVTSPGVAGKCRECEGFITASENRYRRDECARGEARVEYHVTCVEIVNETPPRTD